MGAVGDGADGVRPEGCGFLDYELELGIVVEKQGRDIAVDKAMQYVFGYMIFNEEGDRVLQPLSEMVDNETIGAGCTAAIGGRGDEKTNAKRVGGRAVCRLFDGLLRGMPVVVDGTKDGAKRDARAVAAGLRGTLRLLPRGGARGG